MGSTRKQPLNLPAKLLAIRKHLNLTQDEMLKLVQPGAIHKPDARSIISQFEKGKRAPNLLEIYNYLLAVRERTRYKKFSFDCLADDRLDLPWHDDDNKTGEK